jgi:predicted enzyme related to lactoylglutathione lyase
MTSPRIRLSAAVLGSGDPRRLADFYQRLLGWTVVADEPARPGNALRCEGADSALNAIGTSINCGIGTESLG